MLTANMPPHPGNGRAGNRSQVMNSKLKVEVGQTYVQIAGTHYTTPLWRIIRLYDDGSSIPHACLVKVNNLLHTKTISCVTLANPRFFKLISEGTAKAA
jgi:hypothetical protein